MPRRLTNDQVQKMRELRASGVAQRDLAADFGISQALTSDILRGLRYTDAPGPIETERRYFRRRPNSGG